MTDELNILDDSEQEYFEHHRFIVDPGQSPIRIDRYLSNKIINVSRNKIQLAADANCILVNGKPVKSNYKIKPNDELVVVMTEPPREKELIPENIPLNIVYEDEYLLIVNKKPGMVVHPAYGNYQGTLMNALAFHFKELDYFKNGDLRAGLVHRLDKDTSGILVIAKNEIAKTKLAKQFYDRTTDRRYHALIWGNPKNENGTIIGNIGRNPKNRKVMHVFENGESGKHAITHYKVLERFSYISLIECKLETGRTHQIRAHMKHIKHPIFNDEAYGGNVILKGTTFSKYKQFISNCFSVLPRQALHAKSLAFDHPHTNERMYFDSELPNDMAEVILKWRKYVENR